MRFAFVLSALLCLLSLSPAFAWEEENRTARRTPSGLEVYPVWLMAMPEHYEFLPYTSNWDAQNQHPAQWSGQDWDPAAWNKDWTPETAIRNFYEARIFSAQYMDKKIPVLELGPTFFKLSDLDRRRTLKLLTDYADVFNRGYTVVELRDWYTKDVVGTYTGKGLYLN